MTDKKVTSFQVMHAEGKLCRLMPALHAYRDYFDVRLGDQGDVADAFQYLKGETNKAIKTLAEWHRQEQE